MPSCHGRPARRARRTLERGVPVRAPAPALRLLRRELDGARQRDDRPSWPEPGACTSGRAPPRSARTTTGSCSSACLPSGQVRFFPMCDYVGGARFTSRLSGNAYEVQVRKKSVDATYLEGSVPASTAPPVRSRPGSTLRAGQRSRIRRRTSDRLRDHRSGQDGARRVRVAPGQRRPPGRHRWIKPREAWFLNRYLRAMWRARRHAARGALPSGRGRRPGNSTGDLFARLEADGQLLLRRRAASSLRCSRARP